MARAVITASGLVQAAVQHELPLSTTGWQAGDLVLLDNSTAVRLTHRDNYNRWQGKGAIYQTTTYVIPRQKGRHLTSEQPYTAGPMSFLERQQEFYNIISSLTRSLGSLGDIFNRLMYLSSPKVPHWFTGSLMTSADDCRLLSWAEDPAHVDNDKRRKVGKIKTFLQYCIKQMYIPNIPAPQLERRIAEWGETVPARDGFEFHVVRGLDLVEAYRQSASTWRSCMSENAGVYLYAQNPEKVELVKVMRKVDAGSPVYSGRALLWTLDNGEKLLDRQYPSTALHNIRMDEWARKQGYQTIRDVDANMSKWVVTLLNEIQYSECPKYFDYFDNFRAYPMDGGYGFESYHIPTDQPIVLRYGDMDEDYDDEDDDDDDDN